MRLKQELAKAYILGGWAEVTFFNTQPKVASEDHYTFTVQRKRKGGDRTSKEFENFWFVKQWKTYLGFIHEDGTFHKTANPDTLKNYEKDIAVFSWVWKRIIAQQVPDNIHILHNGKCSRCGLPLTQPTSIYLGFGPECCKILGIPYKMPPLPTH